MSRFRNRSLAQCLRCLHSVRMYNCRFLLRQTLAGSGEGSGTLLATQGGRPGLNSWFHWFASPRHCSYLEGKLADGNSLCLCLCLSNEQFNKIISLQHVLSFFGIVFVLGKVSFLPQLHLSFSVSVGVLGSLKLLFDLSAVMFPMKVLQQSLILRGRIFFVCLFNKTVSEMLKNYFTYSLYLLNTLKVTYS